MKKNKSRVIKVDYLARVEGEGAMYIKIKNDQVEDVKLKIFEPPRFFEAFLRGRNYNEAPDITSRICGICPIAYQMGAVQAMENAFGVKVEGQLKALRRIIYCGEWIESHVLHIFMLHAPDFLGYDDAIQMAKDFPEIVQKGLKLKKIGNKIMTLLGGREIHPINLCVGGFYKVPSKKELRTLLEDLQWARQASIETVKLVSGFEFPEFTYNYEFVSLYHPEDYPIIEGKIISNKGLNIEIHEFENTIIEEHVEHSNALQSIIIGRGSYFVGPMARYNLNFEKLSEISRETALNSGIGKYCNNPFKSIIVRAIEVLYACDEAIRLIENYEEPDKPKIEFIPKESSGFGCTEAPRGICYHGYKIDENCLIKEAKIIPPTSQNQKTIEKDLFNIVKEIINLPEDKIRNRCEQAIRNYDPCISCATHFLKLNIERE